MITEINWLIAQALPTSPVPVTSSASGVSDAVWIALITMVQLIGLAWMQKRTKDSVDRVATINMEAATVAAVKAEEVKTTLAASTEKTDGKLNEIHALTNSAMTISLKTIAMQARQIAEFSKGKGTAIETAATLEAERAEKIYQDHLAKDAALAKKK